MLLLSSFENFLINGDSLSAGVLLHIRTKSVPHLFPGCGLIESPLLSAVARNTFLFYIIQSCVQQPLFPQRSQHNSSTFAHVCTRPVQTGKHVRVESSCVSDQLRLFLVVSSFHYITTNPCLFSRILFFFSFANIPEDRQQRTLSSEACAVTVPAAADILCNAH